MLRYNKILSEIQSLVLNKDIDTITYSNSTLEYPVSSLINFDWKTLLAYPPLNTSNETFNELSLVSRRSLNRSKNDEELLLQIDVEPNYILYQILDRYNLKVPREYIDIFYDLVKPILLNTKYIYNRPRPYQLAKIYNLNLNVIETSTHDTPSYPSGHTFYTTLSANILSYLYPTLKQEFLKSISITGQARINQGVHYPSDNITAIKLANILFQKLNNKVQTIIYQ